jgi:PAS domain S-box-containing protein
MAQGDLFAFAKVGLPAAVISLVARPGSSLNAGIWSWVVVTHVSAAKLAGLRWDVARPFLLIGAFLLPLFGLSAFAASVQYDRLKASEHRREQVEAMARDERLAAFIIESLPIAFIVVHGTGRILRVNEATEKLFGYTRDEMIGQTVEMLMPGRFRRGHESLRKDFVLPDRFGYIMGSGRDLVGRCKNGEEIFIEVGLGQMQIGNEFHFIASVANITARKTAEAELKGAMSLLEDERAEIRRLNAGLERRVAERTAELQDTNRELEAFSYSVSHDLRAPLRVIDGFSQMLEQDYAKRLDEAGQDNITRIRRAAQRMGELIDDMLKLSRIARLDLSRANVDLSAQALEVIDGLRAGAPERVVETEVADGIYARGDARLLRIVLENLLGNAWKFTGRRPTGRIAFGRATVDGREAYFVRDNGAGFDMAYAGKLFGAFQRLHKGPEYPGHGIGLATVQRIVIRHGGRIWAEAEPDKGATFYFTL